MPIVTLLSTDFVQVVCQTGVLKYLYVSTRAECLATLRDIRNCW